MHGEKFDSNRLDEECFVDLQTENPEGLPEAMDYIINTVEDKGMSNDGLKRLQEVTTEYKEKNHTRGSNPTHLVLSKNVKRRRFS